MLIDVSPANPQPLPAQIAAAVRAAVANGTLRPGDTVPSTRALAMQAKVSRGTVVSAYEQLISEGYLLASQGAPTRVHPDLVLAPHTQQRKQATGKVTHNKRGNRRKQELISLKPAPGTAGLIRPAAWHAAWREAASDSGGRVDKAGQVELRDAIAEHLRVARSLAVDPGNVVVTGGSREGLMLILLTLASHSSGRLRIGVESPGHPGLQRVIEAAGHEIVPCPTDSHGVCVDTLPATLDAILVTPAHLYPLGGAMPVARRSQLLRWAAETSTSIIEDDFNAELRYRTAPQPTLAAIAGDGAHVFTLGTFSTLLSRELAAGYVVASNSQAEALGRTRQVLGMPVSAVTQRAIASLLRGGYVRRNTKATHARLAKRRAILESRVVPALAKVASHAQLSDGTGADLIAHFPTRGHRNDFAGVLARSGFEAGRADTALTMSFAHLSDQDFNRAINAIVETLENTDSYSEPETTSAETTR